MSDDTTGKIDKGLKAGFGSPGGPGGSVRYVPPGGPPPPGGWGPIDHDRVVTLRPASIPVPNKTKALYSIVRNRAKAISFERYKDFMDRVMGCVSDDTKRPKEKGPRGDCKGTEHFRGADAYEMLKKGTEAFLMQECGLAIDWMKDDGTVLDSDEAEKEKARFEAFKGLSDEAVAQEIKKNKDKYLVKLRGELRSFPFYETILENLEDIPLKPPGDDVPPNCYGILRSRIEHPCLLELIWSYWHEEGMLVQSMNAISLRFQNKSSTSGRDPLAQVEVNPLRPLSNLLWGYVNDEQHRLTTVRRSYEYDHHYGLRLYGKSVPSKMQPADSRDKFLEAFHNLLNRCATYYKERSDTTVIPDAFPLLNALKEVHLLLTEGMGNQFGDLPWTARVEMLMQEWLLARPEMRQFLGGRSMVPYPERWMGHADTMKKLQGWTDVTVRHFRDLGVFGEQIILTIRYGNWSEITDENDARLWADYWRQEIQGYIHAYRSATGVDLTTKPVNFALPSAHLRKRMAVAARKS